MPRDVEAQAKAEAIPSAALPDGLGPGDWEVVPAGAGGEAGVRAPALPVGLGPGDWEVVPPQEPTLVTDSELQEASDAYYRQAFEMVSKTGLDRQTKASGLAKRLELDPALVEKGLSEFEAAYEAGSLDVRKWRQENPILADLTKEDPRLAGMALVEPQTSAIAKYWRESNEATKRRDKAAGDLTSDNPDYLGKYYDQVKGEVADAIGGLFKHRDPVSHKVLMRMDPSAKGGFTDKMSAASETASLTGERSRLGTRAMWKQLRGGDISAELQQARELSARMEPKYYDANVVEQFGIETANLWGSVKWSLAGAGTGGAIAGVVGYGVGLGVSKGNPLAARQTAMAFASVGSKIGAGVAGGMLEGGNAFLDYVEDNTAKGLPLDKDLAVGYALVYTALAGLTEGVGFGIEMKGFGPLGEVIAAGRLKAFMGSMLKEYTFRKLLKDIGKRQALAAATEAGEEVIQDTLSDVLNYFLRANTIAIASGPADKTINADGSVTEKYRESEPMWAPPDIIGAVEQRIETASSVAQGSIGLAIPMGGVNAVTQAYGAKVMRDASRRDAKILPKLVEAVEGTPSVRRSPQFIHEVVAAAAAESGAKADSVFIDGAKVVEYFQESGKNPAKELSELTGRDGAAILAEASVSGERIEVPMEEYLDKWIPSGAARELVEHSAFSRSTETVSEMKKSAAEARAVADGVEAELQAEEKAGKPIEDPSEKAVAEQFLHQLLTQHERGGREVSAKEAKASVMLLRARMRTASRLFGQPVGTIFQGLQLQIQNGIPIIFGAAEEDDSFDFGANTEDAAVPEATASTEKTNQAENVAAEPMATEPMSPYLTHDGKKPVVEGVAPENTPDTALPDSDPKMVEAREMVSRMKDKKKQAMATAWLDYTQGKLQKSPGVDAALERKLAKNGIVDPTGYIYDEHGSDRKRRVPRKRKGNNPGFASETALRAYNLYRKGIDFSYEDLFQTVSVRSGEESMQDWGLSLLPKGTHLLFQEGGEKVPAGVTRITDDGTKKALNILTTPGRANQSTIPHEMAHVFLEMMRHLDAREDAPEAFKKHVAAVFSQLGISSWDELAREHHEKFARLFETYLMEGHAPSAALHGVFERFRIWFLSIYRNIFDFNAQLQANEGFQVNLNPEWRDIFDRMLATDREIQNTRERMSLNGMFRSPEEAGMTSEQWQSYLEKQAKAQSSVARRSELRMMKDILRERDAWWGEELEDERKAAAEEYENLPAVRIADYLLRGRKVVGSVEVKDDKQGRLDKSKVQKLLGKGEVKGAVSKAYEAVRSMLGLDALKGTEEAKSKLGQRLVKNGEDPEAVAEEFGFPDAGSMLEAMGKAPMKTGWVENTAQQRMIEKHGDMLHETNELRSEVEKGLHGDETLEWLLEELKVLWKKSGRKGEPTLDSVKQAAKAIVSRRGINRLELKRSINAERRASDRAVESAAKGDYAQAFVFKQQQMLHMHIYNELVAALATREKLKDLASEMSSDAARGRLGKSSRVLVDAVDSILAAIDLADMPPKDYQPATIDQAVALMVEPGVDQTVEFDPALISGLIAKPRSWKELSVFEAEEVTMALLNLRGVSRTMNSVIDGEKTADKEWAIQQLVESAPLHMPKFRPEPASNTAVSAYRGVMDGLHWADAHLMRIQTMASWMGGRNPKSPWYRLIIRPIEKAEVREAELLKQIAEPLMVELLKLEKSIPGGIDARFDGAAFFPGWKVESDIPALPPTRVFELVMMLLNYGNASNASRLLEGYNITQEQLEAALRTLPKEAFDWAQAVWDAAESLRPLAFDVEERVAGARPKPIEARPLETQFGTYRGGYFPAIYNRVLSMAGERQSQDSAALMDGSLDRVGTSHSHTKARAEGFVGAISLEPNNIPSGLAKVVHDIAFREAVMSVGGLLLDRKVRAALVTHLGHARASQFLQWVKDVGQMRGADGDVRVKWFMNIVRKIKASTGLAVLGWAFGGFAEDFSNPFSAVSGTELKAKHMTAAIFMLSNPADRENTFKAIEEKSGQVRLRRKQVWRELTSEVAKLTKRGVLSSGPLGWFREHAFDFLETSDKITSTWVWLAAYRQAQEEGKNEEDSIEFADDLMNRVFASHSVVKRAAILRDKGFIGTSTMFYGFLSGTYNNARNITHDFHTDQGWGDFARGVLPRSGKLLAYVCSYGVIGEFLRGKGRDPDEDWKLWFLRKMLTGALTPLPGGGELGSEIERRWFGHGIRAMNPKSLTLPGAVIALGAAVLGEPEKTRADGRETPESEDATRKRIKALVDAQGPVTGISSVGPWKSLSYAYDLAAGNVHPRDPLEALSGLGYGDLGPDRQPMTPLLEASEAWQGSPRPRTGKH